MIELPSANLRLPIEEVELPPSTFTPIPMETLDWEKVHAEMRGIELKLARVKLLFWRCFDDLKKIEDENEDEGRGRFSTSSAGRPNPDHGCWGVTAR